MLRPYQLSAVTWARDTLSRLRTEGSRPSVILQAPTGAGKSVMMDELEPEGVIAPGTDLVRQLQGSVPGARHHLVTNTALSLVRAGRLPRLSRWALDEFRWVASPTGSEIVAAILATGAEIVGFDATPATPQGGGLGRWASDLLQVASMKELIRDGWLVPFRVLAPSEPQRELAARPVDAYLQATPGETAICFAENKAHAAQVVAEFEASKIRAAVLTDDTPSRERARIIAGLADGSITVAVCAQILRQGIDVWRASSIILARAVDSLSLYLQAVGRGGRPVPEELRHLYRKDLCTVLDLRGASGGSSTLGHGLPEDDRTWHLEGVACRPVDALPPCVQCRKCLAWGRGGRCELCGAELPPPPLPRVKVADLIEVRALRDTEGEKRAALTRWVYRELAASRNPWRAAHVYRGTYGAAPPRAWILAAIDDAKGSRQLPLTST